MMNKSGRIRIRSFWCATSAVALIAVMTAPQAVQAATARSAPAAAAAPGAPASASTASGSDASCPAANAAGAASSTVGAPVGVRAIPGQSSATVVWCPPSSGAGSVTSYTVTASNGQKVTATVPNDWAIVDGLTNGSSYSFTVTANTSSASGPAATSNAVTPEPIAKPANVLFGTPQSVSYDQYSMLIGGKRVFITAGEFDPWRTPSPSLWLDDLQKMKADGYNAVTVYFDWDYNSPAPGVYDFSGVRDMNEFLNMAQEAGLYVIARPGPYINAETDGGGIPTWVLTVPNGYRNDNEPYLSAALQWYTEIDSIIAAHQITKGGNVIAYQIENEYTGHGQAADQYFADLESQAKTDGIDVPFTFNQCCGAQTYTSGLGAVNISGTDNYPLGFNCADTNNFGQPYGYPSYPGMPIYLPEYQGGSFDGWGGTGYDNCYTMTGPAFENVYYKNNIAQGATMQSNYMGVGGTNWGWLPYPGVYSSYDYGSAIRETGEIGTPADPNDIVGSKFGENKLINDFETSVAPLAETEAAAGPAADNPAIATMARANPSNGAEFVYVRQADATSTATVSTHLALNTNEAAGYTYDDTNSALSYSGNWTHADQSSGYTNGDYDQTESWSMQAGASTTVTFTGTAVQWIGPKDNNGGIAAVSVDGGPATNVDTYSPAGKVFQQVLYSDTGLSNGTHTLTITVTGNKDAGSSADTVVVDAINVPTSAQLAGYFPTVPQSGTITLQGRDSRMLTANYDFGGQHLVYSTSELATQATIGGTDTALVYDPAGTDGETLLNYTSQPSVKVLSGNVQSAWDPSRNDLRLDYTHNGLQEVQITGGGRSPLLLLIADTNTAEEFWPEQTSAGSVLVEGGYLVRTASVSRGVLDMTGDTSKPGTLRVWAPSSVTSVDWNGRPVTVTQNADGSLSGTIPGPGSVSLPKLSNWMFSYETPEARPGFNDSGWTLADHPSGTAGSPVLHANDYGYDHGFTWYRGHFTATGSETGVTLTADGIAPTGAFSVWLNGAFLGSYTNKGTITFPPGAIQAGKDNVIAVLVENTGNPEGPSGEATGLYSASLAGSNAPITWRLMGAPGGTTLQDPVRGVMNEAGLYGSDNGWNLPNYPDSTWQSVSLPDSWPARGVPAGVGWYRTTFPLNVSGYVPIDVQIGASSGVGTADYRAFIYVNGWLIGRYINNVGPQHDFYVPAGILNDHGTNTLAIAVWSLGSTTGGLDSVSLVAAGNQASSVPIAPVESPGYNAATYGTPTLPKPTLAAVPSTTLATGSFTVKATLRNPTSQTLGNASLSLNAPSGWTVTPSGSTSAGNVAPGASASQTFTVTGSTSGASPGAISFLATADYTFSGKPHSLINSAQVQVPYANLASTYDNIGISDDSNTSAADFDGAGYSYSEQALTADGLAPGATVQQGGLTFTWPNVPPGQADNTAADGQVIDMSGHGATLGFLGASNSGSPSGIGTIYYTDGSTQTFTLQFDDFWYTPGPENTIVASEPYVNNSSTGRYSHTVYIFYAHVPIDSGKQVMAVALPAISAGSAGHSTAMHIFAMSVG